jgi:hypothetical protein
MEELTSNAKGAIAENAITAEALRLGIRVLRPVVPGARYDLAFELPSGIVRVQCKWGRLVGDCVVAQIGTSRHSPTRGYIRTSYDPGEVDAFAIWCDDLDAAYYVPIKAVVARQALHLRLGPAKNNQRIGVTMAADHTLGAIAQLGERLTGSQKVAGSSPASSTS